MPGCCSRCGRRVYAAEEKLALDRSWHMECFTCAICNRTLDSSNLAECKVRDEIYCSGCYRKYFGLQGYGFGTTMPTLIVHNRLVFEKLPNDCPENGELGDNNYLPQDPRLIPPPPSRLGVTYIPKSRLPLHYENHPSLNPGDPCVSPPRGSNNHEDYKSMSSNFHDESYQSDKSDPCANFTDPGDQTQTDSESVRVRDEECRSVSPLRQPSLSPNRNSGNVNRSSYETSSDEHKRNHQPRNYCISPSPPRRNLYPKISSDDIAPNPPIPPSSAGPHRTSNSTNQSSFQRKLNSVEKPSCRKCKQPVFHAEIQHGYRGTYHIDCFRCGSCSKQLNPGTVNEDQGELFCTACYRRNFGTH